MPLVFLLRYLFSIKYTFTKTVEGMESNETQLGALRLALENPRLYIFNYISELKNQIDLECQKFLNSQEDLENEQSITALEVQSTLIQDVSQYESECYKNLETSQLDSTIRSQAKEAIDKAECRQQAKESLRLIQEQLFLNRTFVFIARDSPLIADTVELKIKSFGVLVIVEDKFIAYEDYLNRNKLQERIAKQSNTLAVEFLKSSLGTNVQRINLDVDKVDICDLRSRELTELTAQLFKGFIGLIDIDLSRNQLISLDPGLFQNLPNLQALNLSHNQLTHLDQNIFTGLAKLHAVYLGHNQLDELSFNLFQGLCNLETIDLDNNLIKELDFRIFNGLKRLESIGLAQNQLKRIDPRTLRGLSSLRTLFLMDNQLDGLEPDTFEGLVSLKSIDLGNNLIREVDVNVFRGLSQLQFIGLGDNQLSSFDSQVTSGLKTLFVVYLKGNRLDQAQTSNVFSSVHILGC